MESDSVRTIGDSTLVDIWLGGKVRSISVSCDAIADFKGLPAGQAKTLTEDERSEFVRTHLTLIAKTAAARVSDNPGAQTVCIESGQIRADEARQAHDRRQSGDRRKGERRKSDLGPPGVERRRP
jgi:hypothetical protein